MAWLKHRKAVSIESREERCIDNALDGAEPEKYQDIADWFPW